MIYDKICMCIALIVLHNILPKFGHQCKLKCFLKYFNFLGILRRQANTFNTIENFSKLSENIPECVKPCP